MKIFAFQRQKEPFNIEIGGTKGGILHVQFPEKSDEEILDIAVQERRNDGRIPLDAVVHIIDDSVIPAGSGEWTAVDSKYFEDWEWDDATKRPVVNMPKAWLRHMNIIRKARVTALEEQNVRWHIAEDDEDEATKADVRIKRKALRAIPQTFDLSIATTVDELEALWPSGITRPPQ